MQYYQTPDGQLYVAGDADLVVGDDMFLGDDMIVGDDMLVGADELMYLGADPKVAARAAAVKRARQIALARAGGGFVSRPKIKIPAPFDLPMPFSLLVPNGATLPITIIPTRTTKISNLVVDDQVAGQFTLNSFQSGAENIFSAGGGFNMEIFSSRTTQKIELGGFTATVGVPVIMSVTNNAVVPLTISGVIKGPTQLQVG